MSPRPATPRSWRRSARLHAPRARACWAPAPTPTTTAPSTRWPRARRAAPPRSVAGARDDRRRASTSGPARGGHPHVGVLDVAPVVFLDDARRPAALAEALAPRRRAGRAWPTGVPLRPSGRAAAPGRELRRGGLTGLTAATACRLRPARAASDRAAPCSSPRARRSSPSTSSSRRPRRWRTPRAIAARDPRGRWRACPASARSASSSTRAGVAQVSTNVEDHRAARRRPLVAAVARPRAAWPRAELVGLAPARGVRRLPRPRRDPQHRRALEDASTASSSHGPDEAQAPHEAPRQRRRHGRGARPHRPQPPPDAPRAKAARRARERRMDKPPSWTARAIKAPAIAACCSCSLRSASSARTVAPGDRPRPCSCSPTPRWPSSPTRGLHARSEQPRRRARGG